MASRKDVHELKRHGEHVPRDIAMVNGQRRATKKRNKSDFADADESCTMQEYESMGNRRVYGCMLCGFITRTDDAEDKCCNLCVLKGVTQLRKFRHFPIRVLTVNTRA